MSAPDPLDDASAQLFSALRDEPVLAGSERRALLAARGALEARSNVSWLRRPVLWVAVATAATLAASLALFLRPATLPERISAEPAHSVPRPRSEQPVPRAAEMPSAPTRVSPLAPRGLSSSLPVPSQSAPVTLGDELAALKIASVALNAGDPAKALSALDNYERVLKGKQLRAEATLLKIQALARAGQAEAASALAERFVKQNPDSPLVDRARSFVQEK